MDLVNKGLPVAPSAQGVCGLVQQTQLERGTSLRDEGAIKVVTVLASLSLASRDTVLR